MNDLINIKVIQKDFNGEKKRFVSARELHQWLKVGKRFATWIADRIEKYDFVENLDYFITIPNSGNGLKPKCCIIFYFWKEPKNIGNFWNWPRKILLVIICMKKFC